MLMKHLQNYIKINMENKKIKEVLVVEGKNDTNQLKKFFDVDTIETNGLGINKKTIELINNVNSKRGVILLLDPDTPGEKIRKKINDAIPGLKNVFLFKKEARTTKKVGVEHASKDVLEKAFENVVTYNKKIDSISYEEFIELGLVGKNDSCKKREKVSNKYRLGKCNAKTLFKRLNMIGICKKDIAI